MALLEFLGTLLVGMMCALLISNFGNSFKLKKLFT